MFLKSGGSGDRGATNLDQGVEILVLTLPVSTDCCCGAVYFEDLIVGVPVLACKIIHLIPSRV